MYNDSKSSHVIFFLHPGIKFENKIIPYTNEVKYLGLLFDRWLTWGPRLKTKLKDYHFQPNTTLQIPTATYLVIRNRSLGYR
ncbi:ribosome biogenesis protein TSR3 isoform X1 [Aphis craccivora]|uniref:Ribosome biogenesis protein TSR3 isoform X1 n=1 Tax=Aphis craccivora TaxID=307492 RepID=A0A6G0ZDN8_APHCR|nr:ribosome biogenesis protein TSR3 isoform X1 [Aphis craccivora]